MNGQQINEVASGAASTSLQNTAFRPAQNQASAASITYTPTQVSSLVPWAFMGMGVLFVGVGLLFTIVFLFVFPPVALVTLLFGVFGFVFVAFGAWRWYSNRQRRLQLTSHALTSFAKGSSLTLQLAEVSAIAIQDGFYWAQDPLSRIDMPTRHHYWVVRIQSHAGNYLDLDVTQDGYIGLYDVPRVLRDLLPRLPPSAQVDPRVQKYLSSGRVI